jgi:hypothetical protein
MKNKFLFSLLVFTQYFCFGQNLIQNGDFSSGLNSWTTFAADFDGVSANFAILNEEAAITNMVINDMNPQIWHVQLFQEFTTNQIDDLVVGQAYTVSFRARSSQSGRQLRMFMGQNQDPFQANNMSDFVLTDQMESYQVSFLLNATFASMKLGFEMGLASSDVFIDDVSLVAGGEVEGSLVTFRLDMSGFEGSYTTPEVNGTFNDWCGNCNPMTNVSGDIWETTITLENGTYEYKFSYDNWAGQENLIPGSSCTVTAEQFTNRVLEVSDDIELPEVCWNYCVSCDVVSLDANELALVSVYPNPSNDYITITSEGVILAYTVVDYTGREVLSRELNANQFTIQVSEFSNGIYSLHVLTTSGFYTRSFIKQ